MLKLTSDLAFVPCRRCGRSIPEGEDYCDSCEGPLHRAVRRVLETAGGNSPRDKKNRARIVWWVIGVFVSISLPALYLLVAELGNDLLGR